MELFKKLFPNETPENLHNSFIDILLTLRCYYKTKFRYRLVNLIRRARTMHVVWYSLIQRARIIYNYHRLISKPLKCELIYK